MTPIRHDWAGPASIGLLFNCHGCAFSFLDTGSGEAPYIPADESYDLIASFNLQCVGKVREGMDVVKAVEAVGSQSGKPSKTVEISDSGELEMPAEAEAEA